MVKELRRRCGERYPIMYRIDLTLAFRATYGKRMETVPKLKLYRNERAVDMTLDYMRNLVKAGIDLFDVDLGGYDNWWLAHPPYPMPPGAQRNGEARTIHLAREALEAVREAHRSRILGNPLVFHPRRQACWRFPVLLEQNPRCGWGTRPAIPRSATHRRAQHGAVWDPRESMHADIRA
jgi:hypothetical protein